MVRNTLVFFSLLLICSSMWAQPGRGASNMERGMQAYRNNQLYEALSFFTAATAENPVPDGAFDYKGYVNFVLGNYTDAERDFSFAIERGLRSQQGVTGAIRSGNMTLVEPGQASAALSLAALYNNRGVTRFNLNRPAEAMQDFNTALSLDPRFEYANQNRSYALQPGAAPAPYTQPNPNGTQPSYGNTNPGVNPNPTWPITQPGGNGTYRAFNPFPRPVSTPEKLNTTPAETSVALRRNRVIEYEAKATGKAPKTFTTRRFRKSITYHLPTTAATSENYLRLESVQITQEATIVTITVENPESKPFQVNIEEPGKPDAYVMVDRTGKQRFLLRTISGGMARFPSTTELAVRGKLTFVLEFEKLPDDVGFVHILEGNRTDGWNFYMVDLTKK